jgi:hypothetical protein
MRRLSFLPVSLLWLASCVGPPAPPAPPSPIPVPAPRPAPPPPAPPPPAFTGDWRDWPVTAGTWDYRQDARGSIALFGARGGDAEFTIRCDRLRRQLYLSRRGASPGNLQMTIRTSSTMRALAVAPAGGAPAYMATPLAPDDALIDAMGFSRGRFVVDLPPMPALVIPAWAEVLRVAEDCRRGG